MANKVYSAFESDVTFNSTNSGAQYVAFSPSSLPAASGHISVPRDLGSGSHSTLFRWRARTVCETTPTLGNTVDIYWCPFDNPTYVDGNMASGDYHFTQTDKRRNMQWIGAIMCDIVATGVPFITSGLVNIYSRYGSVVWINQMGATLSLNGLNHEFILTPTPDEIQ